jgi:imidazolonepropionase-like amidohydrolase
MSFLWHRNWAWRLREDLRDFMTTTVKPEWYGWALALEDQKPVHILVGWLFDGSGGPVKRRVLLTVRDGVVETLKTNVIGDLPTDKVMDLGCCTMVPPLVDCHVHLCLSGKRDPVLRQAQAEMSFEMAQSVIRTHLVDDLAHGIMAVRDAGDHSGHALRFKQRGLPKEDLPVEVRCAGRAWHAPGRYGRLLGCTPEAGESLSEAFRRSETSVDQFKVIDSGINSLSEFGRPTPPQFRSVELRQAVALAAGRGLPTMIHANGERPVREGIEAGCRSIEHGYFMGAANLESMVSKGVFWVPTVLPMAVFARGMEGSAHEKDVAARTVEQQMEQLRMARAFGVNVALGTDSGSFGVLHGYAVAEELGLLVEAGLPLAVAVQCATANGAQLLGLADQMGRIAPGLPASFVVIDGSPDELLEQIMTPHSVWVRGKLLNQRKQEKP